MTIKDLDNRFGTTAIKLGFITSEQLLEALTVQVKENVNDGIHRLIGSILREKGYMTVEQIEQVYMTGWKLGLKALAIYRDGSKRSQPVSTKKQGPNKPEREAEKEAVEDKSGETYSTIERRPQRIRRVRHQRLWHRLVRGGGDVS